MPHGAPKQVGVEAELKQGIPAAGRVDRVTVVADDWLGAADHQRNHDEKNAQHLEEFLRSRIILKIVCLTVCTAKM